MTPPFCPRQKNVIKRKIFVAVVKFTKWIKVKLAASITTAKVMEFIKEIIYQFVVPNNIIINNGTQHRFEGV
jgi:hypothetical protein